MKIERVNEFANKPVIWHWYYQIRDYNTPNGIEKDTWGDAPYLIYDPLNDEDESGDDIDWNDIEDKIGSFEFDSSAYQNLTLFKELVKQLQKQNTKSHIKLVKVTEEIIN